MTFDLNDFNYLGAVNDALTLAKSVAQAKSVIADASLTNDQKRDQIVALLASDIALVAGLNLFPPAVVAEAQNPALLKLIVGAGALGLEALEDFAGHKTVPTVEAPAA